MDTTNTCKCGCGAEVARSFKPGHDAKLKSSLLGETKSNAWWTRESSVNKLIELGWGHHVELGVLDRTPVRVRFNGRYTRSKHINCLTYTCTDEAGTTHASQACPAIEGVATEGDRGWACNVCIHTLTKAEEAHCGRWS